jgi:RimJ/RimL family protein N-acetyltransferase
MALIKPVEFISKKGRRVVIRNPESCDAQKILDSLIEIAESTIFILTSAESFRKITLTEEEKIISSFNSNEKNLFLIAEVDNQIIGNLTFRALNDTKRFHRGSLAITLLEPFRGDGIAKKMMQVLIEFVRTIPKFRYLELEVMDLNSSAIALYKKIGFQILHQTPKAYILSDGSEPAEIKMRLEVSP